MTALNTQGVLRGKPEVLINSKTLRQKKYFLDITALIRSVQRAEGNIDCFRTENADRDRLDCAWRTYYLTKDSLKKEE